MKLLISFYLFFQLIFFIDGFSQVNPPYIKILQDSFPDFKNGSSIYHCKYKSDIFKQEVGYAIYLPKSYFLKPDSVFPVIYYLHGLNGSYFLQHDKVKHWNNQMEKDYPECIIVLVNGILDNGYLGKVEKSIITELKPHLELNYRVSKKGECNAIAGFSLGGNGSLHLALLYPEIFGQVVSLHGTTVKNDDILYYNNKDDKKVKIWLSTGTEDQFLEGARSMHKALKNASIVHEYKEYAGLSHNSTTLFNDSIARNEIFSWMLNNFKETCPVLSRQDPLPELDADELPFVEEDNPFNEKRIPKPPVVINLKTDSLYQVHFRISPISSGILGYFVYRRLKISDEYELIDTLEPDQMEYVDSNLLTCQYYYYTVSCYNAWGKSAISNTYFTKTSCVKTSVLETNKNKVRIFPNPCESEIYISTYMSDVLQTKVYSIEGKLLVDKDKTMDQSLINMSNLPSGIYFITCQTREGNFSQKIIKK